MTAQPGLCQTWSETPKTGFIATRLILKEMANIALNNWLLISKNLHCFSLHLHLLNAFPFQPDRYEKTGFLAYVKTKTRISFPVTMKLISAFVFAIRILQSLYFLKPNFQASSHLLWLYSPVCVGPGRKP